MTEWKLALPEQVVVTGTSSGLGKEIALLLTSTGVSVYGVDTAAPAENTGQYGELHRRPRQRYRHRHLAAHHCRRCGRSPRRSGLARLCGLGGRARCRGPRRRGHRRLAQDLGSQRIGQCPCPARTSAVVDFCPGRAAVVAVSSVNAQFGEQQLAAYSSSKAALSSAIRTIALDYARNGVRINILAPGPMRAGLFERHLAAAADPARFLATREARQPIGRLPGADEVAQAAAFLLSSGASALFASTVTADGGLTASFDFRTGAEGSPA